MLQELPMNFLLYRDHHYELITPEGSELKLLPSVPIELKQIMQEQGISFNVVGDICTVYDKNLYLSRKVYLPVYIEENGKYTYKGKFRAKKIPTKESLEAAESIVLDLLQKEEVISLLEKIEIKQLLGDKTMVFIPKPMKLLEQKSEIMKKYKIFCFEVSGYGYILVDYKKIKQILKEQKGKPVTLLLRTSYDNALIVGKDGRNIKPLAQLLHVKQICVLPDKDQS